MEPEEQIYVNIEELSDIHASKHQRTEQAEPKPAKADDVVREETETCFAHQLATVCLGLLGFILLTAVIGVSAAYDRDFYQLSRDLANQTAEKDQLLVQYQNLTEERDQIQHSLRSAKLELDTVRKKFGTCPPGWTQFRCSCYILSTSVKSWDSGQRDCTNQGAHLVIVNSRQEMEFLNGLASNQRLWIGLSKSQSNWRWTDGTSLGTSYWRAGHPFQQFQFQSRWCAVFNSFRSGWGIQSWTAENCSVRLKWVCERQVHIQ
ncbi:uncharacterized protein V6R79_024180 [Siganus canaliculatus]